MANRITVAAHDAVEELRQKMKTSSDAAHRLRLKIIIAAKSDEKRSDIAERLMVSRQCVSHWVGKYNKGGSDALKTNKGGRPKGNPKWDTSIFDALAKEIDKGGYWSVPRMMEWIEEHHKKNIPEQTVWYHMDKLKYSYNLRARTPYSETGKGRRPSKKEDRRHTACRR